MPASVVRTRRLVLPLHYPIGIRGHEGRRESSMTWFRRPVRDDVDSAARPAPGFLPDHLVLTSADCGEEICFGGLDQIVVALRSDSNPSTLFFHASALGG